MKNISFYEQRDNGITIHNLSVDYDSLSMYLKEQINSSCRTVPFVVISLRNPDRNPFSGYLDSNIEPPKVVLEERNLRVTGTYSFIIKKTKSEVSPVEFENLERFYHGEYLDRFPFIYNHMNNLETGVLLTHSSLDRRFIYGIKVPRPVIITHLIANGVVTPIFNEMNSSDEEIKQGLTPFKFETQLIKSSSPDILKKVKSDSSIIPFIA